MNLTIPIMDGQIADIKIYDTKTKEYFTYMADHNNVQVLRSTDSKSVTAFKYSATSNRENVEIKGIGRNKRRCSKSLTLK